MKRCRLLTVIALVSLLTSPTVVFCYESVEAKKVKVTPAEYENRRIEVKVKFASLTPHIRPLMEEAGYTEEKYIPFLVPALGMRAFLPRTGKHTKIIEGLEWGDEVTLFGKVVLPRATPRYEGHTFDKIELEYIFVVDKIEKGWK